MSYGRRWYLHSTYKEKPGVAGSTFDGGWGTRWWQDVDRGTENKKWAVGVGEDGKVGVYGGVTVDASGIWMLEGSWNFSWDDRGVPVEEDAEVGGFMSLVGLVDGIWSEVFWIDEEKSWRKGGCSQCLWFWWSSCRIKQNNLTFQVEGCCCDCKGGDWESLWTERRFDLGTEDVGEDLIIYDCDKYDDDDWDDCGDNSSSNFFITNFENLIFPFSIR